MDCKASDELASLATVSEECRKQSISQLHLSTKLDESLTRDGIITMGLLIDQLPQLVTSLNAPLGKALRQTLVRLAASVQEGGSISWAQFWEASDIELVPEGAASSDDLVSVITVLPETIRQVIYREFARNNNAERIWTILERRYGLNGVNKATLADLGDAFGLTRERVRQLEVQAISRLQDVLIEGQYAGRTYRISPHTFDSIRLLCDVVIQDGSTLATESTILNRVQQLLSHSFEEVKPVLFFLFSLTGYERITFDSEDIEPIWGVMEVTEKHSIETVVREIYQVMTKSMPLAAKEFDILLQVNKQLSKNAKMSPLALQRALTVCSFMEKVEDQTYRCKFEFLSGRGNQAERILTEYGKPLSIAEIAREMNHRLVKQGKGRVEVRNLGNQISGDARFVTIGNSGHWGLKTWKNIDTRTIIAIMEEFLVIRNSPATTEEIFSYVAERRPVSEKSVIMYLYAEKPFIKMSLTTWGLATWSESKDAKIWSTVQVAEFVAEMFKKKRVKEMPFRDVRQALVEAANVTPRQAQGMLIHCPAIMRRKGEKWGERFVELQNVSEGYIARKPYQRTKATLRERVADSVRKILEAQPNNEIMLADLMPLMLKELQCPKPTLYQYLSKLEFIESVAVPSSNTKIIRLKNAIKAAPIAIAQQIVTGALREAVVRGLQKLTEDDVDLGLFLLSKEFEATLKHYLAAANDQGKIVVNLGKDQTKWKLANMVDTARLNQIITDIGALQYLREQRNNRAHGEMPTLEERRLMLESAGHFAGMYTGYIKLLDDKYNELKTPTQ